MLGINLDRLKLVFKMKKIIILLVFIILISGCTKSIGTPPSQFVGRYGDDSNTTGAVYIRGTDSNLSLSNALFVVESDSRDGTPQFLIQDDGEYQASFITRSFMVVNQNNTLLNSEQPNDCRDWGFSHLDCNTASTGADFGVTDDIEAQGLVFADQGLRAHSTITGAYMVLNDDSKEYQGYNGEFDATLNIFCDYTSNNFVDTGGWIVITTETGEYTDAHADINAYINSSCVELHNNPAWIMDINDDTTPTTWEVTKGIQMIAQKGGFFEYYVGDSDKSGFKIRDKYGMNDYSFIVDSDSGHDGHVASDIKLDLNGYSGIAQQISVFSSSAITDKQLSMISLEADATNMNGSDGVYIDMGIIGQPILGGHLDGIHFPAGLNHLLEVGSADIITGAYYEATDILSEVTTDGLSIEILTLDNDVVYFGNDGEFTTISFQFDSPSSTNIAPNFYYCNTAEVWTPLIGTTDSTSGFTSSGTVNFINPSDRGTCNKQLDGTPFTDVTKYTYIAVERTRNNIVNPPVINLVGISGGSTNMFMAEDILKLAPTNSPPETCNAANLGAIYFDISQDAMCACRSGGWKVISTGGVCI